MPLKSQVPSQSPKVTRATSAAACSPCCHLATDMNVSTATATGPRAALSQAVKRLRSCSTFQLQIVLFLMPLWQSRLQVLCLWVSHPSVPLMLTRQFRSTLMEILQIQYRPSLRVYDVLITFCWPEVKVCSHFYIVLTLVKKTSQKYLMNWLYVCSLARQLQRSDLNSGIQVIHLVSLQEEEFSVGFKTLLDFLTNHLPECIKRRELCEQGATAPSCSKKPREQAWEKKLA